LLEVPQTFVKSLEAARDARRKAVKKARDGTSCPTATSSSSPPALLCYFVVSARVCRIIVNCNPPCVHGGCKMWILLSSQVPPPHPPVALLLFSLKFHFDAKEHSSPSYNKLMMIQKESSIRPTERPSRFTSFCGAGWAWIMPF
jgi:hypothetical protein